jgi:hypothetical protein
VVGTGFTVDFRVYVHGFYLVDLRWGPEICILAHVPDNFDVGGMGTILGKPVSEGIKGTSFTQLLSWYSVASQFKHNFIITPGIVEYFSFSGASAPLVFSYTQSRVWPR